MNIQAKDLRPGDRIAYTNSTAEVLSITDQGPSVELHIKTTWRIIRATWSKSRPVTRYSTIDERNQRATAHAAESMNRLLRSYKANLAEAERNLAEAIGWASR